MRRFIRKNIFLGAIVLLILFLLIIRKSIGLEAIAFTGKNALSFAFMLAPIFICIGLMDVWIEKDVMIKMLGAGAGAKGILLSLALGVVTAVPLYALLPVAGILLKKGSGISNVLIFLCSSASIRIPLLLFEISSLGWRFTLVQLILNVLTIFVIVLIINKTLFQMEEIKKI